RAAGSVAAYDHHLDGARAQLDVVGDVGDVVAQDVVLGGPPRRHVRRTKGPLLDLLAQLLDLGTVDGALAADDLEAVVLGRVVAGGDHHAAVGAQVKDREVEPG